jgi:hypothetical protein
VTFIVPLSVEPNTNNEPPVVTIAHATDTNTYSTLATATLDNATACVGVYHVATRGRSRYIKCTVTPGTHTTNSVVIAPIVTLQDVELKGQTNDSTGQVSII